MTNYFPHSKIFRRGWGHRELEHCFKLNSFCAPLLLSCIQIVPWASRRFPSALSAFPSSVNSWSVCLFPFPPQPPEICVPVLFPFQARESFYASYKYITSLFLEPVPPLPVSTLFYSITPSTTWASTLMGTMHLTDFLSIPQWEIIYSSI